MFGGTNDDFLIKLYGLYEGKYIAVGQTKSNDGDVSGNHGGYDLWVVNLDTAGNILWQKYLWGASGDEPGDIAPTVDGGYLVGGYTYSNDGDVTGNHGDSDFWIVKLHENGDIQWQKCLGGSRKDQLSSVIATSDSGYLAQCH